MAIQLYSHGGAEEVTGSKHFLSINGKTIMVDCGAFQGRREESDRKNRIWSFDPKTIDAAILTHAHYDHCGLLPLLVAKGYKKNIYATAATKELANLILLDSAHIQNKDLAFLRKHRDKNGRSIIKEPLYKEDDVNRCIGRIAPKPYHDPFPLLENVTATLYDAGHILGSSMARLELHGHGDTPLAIGFTGDLGRKNLPIIRDPDYLPPVDYLVLESTYGNRLHESAEKAMDILAEIITAAIAKKGRIIIPAFAMERTQELVFFIHLLRDQGKIPVFPIFVDSPMAVNATAIFAKHLECFDEQTRQVFIDHGENPFGFNELTYITDKVESQKLNQLKEPCIIISSSGMCENGRILHHLIHSISDPNTTILIVGFMAENTLGRRLVEKAAEVKIFDNWFPVNATVKKLNSFSGHADYNEILDYVAHLDKTRLKKIFLVHGEKAAQENLSRLLTEQGLKNEIVRIGQRYELG